MVKLKPRTQPYGKSVEGTQGEGQYKKINQLEGPGQDFEGGAGQNPTADMPEPSSKLQKTS